MSDAPWRSAHHRRPVPEGSPPVSRGGGQSLSSFVELADDRQVERFRRLCFERRADGHAEFGEGSLAKTGLRLQAEALEELADLWNYAQFGKERATVRGSAKAYAFWHNEVQLPAERLALALLSREAAEALSEDCP